MPGEIAGTDSFMRFLANEVSRDTYVNVMGQYYPLGGCRRRGLWRSIDASAAPSTLAPWKRLVGPGCGGSKVISRSGSSSRRFV
jgi:hypothetical protein